MASVQTVTSEFTETQRTGLGARRVREVAVALIIATLFAGLWGAYFAVNAGESYPEPYTLMTD